MSQDDVFESCVEHGFFKKSLIKATFFSLAGCLILLLGYRFLIYSPAIGTLSFVSFCVFVWMGFYPLKKLSLIQKHPLKIVISEDFLKYSCSNKKLFDLSFKSIKSFEYSQGKCLIHLKTLDGLTIHQWFFFKLKGKAVVLSHFSKQSVEKMQTLIKQEYTFPFDISKL